MATIICLELCVGMSQLLLHAKDRAMNRGERLRLSLPERQSASILDREAPTKTKTRYQHSTMMATASSKQRATRPCWKPDDFPYQADYNDHFETPLQAYKDIKPLIDCLCKKGKKSPIVVYDPYYCDGRAAQHLQQVGFSNIIHEKRDFYKDIKDNTVPNHDILITNPPYSDEHKKKCLDFCLRQLDNNNDSNKLFFVLLPAYVAMRHYYKELIDKYKQSVIYLVPRIDYDYEHPEGTGKDTSPFKSLWFCGIGKYSKVAVKSSWEKLQLQSHATSLPFLAMDVSDLERAGVVTTAKRPNPKQRKKRKQPVVDTLVSSSPPTTLVPTSVAITFQSVTYAKSKWRDESGKRTRKRF